MCTHDKQDFEREVQAAYEQPTTGMPHDAMVELTLKKWLPRLVPPPPKPVNEGTGEGQIGAP